MRAVTSRISADHRLSPRVNGWDHAGRVAGVDAGLLDVLHHRRRSSTLWSSATASTSTSRAPFQELVEQHRLVGGDERLAAPASPRGLLGRVDRPACRARPARTTGRTSTGIAERRARTGSPARLDVGARGSPADAAPAPRSAPRKRSRFSARSSPSYGVPHSGTPASCSVRASLSGVWPPSWTMTPSGCSGVDRR